MTRTEGSVLVSRSIRRDARAVEWARLESVCAGNRTEGSNPSLSAILRLRLRMAQPIPKAERSGYRDRKTSREILHSKLIATGEVTY